MTGTTYDSVPPPGDLPSNGIRARTPRADDCDYARGLGEISRRLPGLELAESAFHVTLEPDAAIGYVEWTLEFRNSAVRENEARVLIKLPAGGVVSRVSGWVNGEEREAAFGRREQVLIAYWGVVEKKRDPLLVTTLDRDRVLVQCYPVSPDGGRMKARNRDHVFHCSFAYLIRSTFPCRPLLVAILAWPMGWRTPCGRSHPLR